MKLKDGDLKKVDEMINLNSAGTKVSLDNLGVVFNNLVEKNPTKKKPWHALLPSVPERRVIAAKKAFIKLGYKEQVNLKEYQSKRKTAIVMRTKEELKDFNLDSFSISQIAIARTAHFYSHSREQP